MSRERRRTFSACGSRRGSPVSCPGCPGPAASESAAVVSAGTESGASSSSLTFASNVWLKLSVSWFCSRRFEMPKIESWRGVTVGAGE